MEHPLENPLRSAETQRKYNIRGVSLAPERSTVRDYTRVVTHPAVQ